MLVPTKMMTGIVALIARFSVNDGPGIRTTVFLKGCRLRCRWCHSPETWNPNPEIYFDAAKCKYDGKCIAVCPVPKAIDLEAGCRINRELCIMSSCLKCTDVCPYGALTKVGKRMTVTEVIGEVERDVPFYVDDGGMTISGGEPLFQIGFTAGLLKVAKEKGIHTCVETSGYCSGEDIERVIPYTDLFLYDIKQMDDAIHKKATGASNRIILENARRIAQHVDIRFRVPLVPGVNDTEEFFDKLATFARSIGVRAVDILPYHNYAKAKYIMLGRENLFWNAGMLDEDLITQFEKQLQACGFETTIGG